jgi:hypothetical protein
VSNRSAIVATKIGLEGKSLVHHPRANQSRAGLLRSLHERLADNAPPGVEAPIPQLRFLDHAEHVLLHSFSGVDVVVGRDVKRAPTMRMTSPSCISECRTVDDVAMQLYRVDTRTHVYPSLRRLWQNPIVAHVVVIIVIIIIAFVLYC